MKYVFTFLKSFWKGLAKIRLGIDAFEEILGSFWVHQHFSSWMTPWGVLPEKFSSRSFLKILALKTLSLARDLTSWNWWSLMHVELRKTSYKRHIEILACQDDLMESNWIKNSCGGQAVRLTRREGLERVLRPIVDANWWLNGHFGEWNELDLSLLWETKKS